MAVQLDYNSTIKATETLSSGLLTGNSDVTVVHDAMTTIKTLNASSTPAVTKTFEFTATLSGGAVTIDLTSLTGTNGVTGGTITGLNVIAVKFKAPTTNTAAFYVNAGASNGNTALGTAFKVAISPGGEVLAYSANGALAEVDATHKTWDCTGTGTETCNIIVVAG